MAINFTVKFYFRVGEFGNKFKSYRKKIERILVWAKFFKSRRVCTHLDCLSG